MASGEKKRHAKCKEREPRLEEHTPKKRVFYLLGEAEDGPSDFGEFGFEFERLVSSLRSIGPQVRGGGGL